MNISPPEKSNSFYESFSDLIFATMAIFVLIMIVLLVQIQPIEESSASTEPVEEAVEEDVIEVKALELVIAVDGTGSMAQPLKLLENAINSVAEAIPLATAQFRIGIVLYRQDLEVFQLRQIKPAEQDNGISLRSVTSFTSDFAPISSPANVAGAIDRSLAMFSDSSSRKSLMLLGDTGPYETVQRTADGARVEVNCRRPDAEAAAYSKIKRLKETARPTIFTLFAASEQAHPCRQTTVRFFNELAALGNDGSEFSDDLSKIMVFLLKAALKDLRE